MSQQEPHFTTRSIGTAGLVLALACASTSAELISRPINASIGGSYGYNPDTMSYFGIPASLDLDVDLDAVIDLRLVNEPVAATGVQTGFMNHVRGLNGAAIVGAASLATPLHTADVVGATSTFAPTGTQMHTFSNSAWFAGGSLDWTEPGGAFLDFSFLRSGLVHYGFLRLDVDLNDPIGRTTLHELVYESQPQTSVIIPEPGLLLPGLACLWLTQSRRRRIA
jgi:hypothetical protein